MQRKTFAISTLLLVLVVGYVMCAPTVETAGYPVPLYDLTVRILPQARRLEVSGTLKLPAVNKSREVIPLLLNESMRDFQVEVLNPAANAGPAQMEGRKVGARVFWLLKPKSPFPAGEEVLLKFSYSGGEKDGFVFSMGPEVSFAHGLISAWYPLADAGGYTGHLGTLRFLVPPEYKVMATGVTVSTPQEQSTGVYRFQVNWPSAFSFSAGLYTVSRQKGKVGSPEVAAYLLRPRPNIPAFLANVSKVLQFLSQQFGPYPFREFAVVEIPVEKASGFFGASTSGFVMVSAPYIERKFDYSLYGHEISHQWWGVSIREGEGKGQTLLSEGMAEFGGLLTVEHFEGAASAASYREIGYPTIGKYTVKSCLGRDVSVPSLHGYLMMSVMGSDSRLDSLRGESAHAIAVSKGFLVLDLLSRTVGRGKFRQTLLSLSEKYRFREITWGEFLRKVEEGSGQNLKWFFEQWFERTGAPDWNLTWKQEGKTLRGVITQAEPYYQAKVELQAIGTQGKSLVREVNISGARTEFSLPVKFPVRSVVIDPHFLVPHWTPNYRAEAEAIRACQK